MAFNYQAAVNITAHYSGEGEIGRASRDIKGLSGTVGSFKTLMKTFAVGYVAKQIADFGKSVINSADALGELRQKTGVGVRALSDLKAAAEDNGVEFGQLESSLKKFSNTLANAQAGSRESQSGFRALGFSPEEIRSFRSADEALFAIADKFKNTADGADKLAVAQALAGRGAADLIPLLNGGREAIEGMGVQMSDKFVRQSDLFNDQLNKLARNAEQFGVRILENVLPYLNQLLDWVGRIRITGLGIIVDEPKLKAPESTGSKGNKLDTSFLKKGGGEIDKAQKALEKFIATQGELIDQRKLEIDRVNMTEDAYERLTLRNKILTDAVQASAGMSDDQKKKFLEVANAAIVLQNSLADLEQQQRQSISGGIKEGWKEYVESAKNTASQVKDVFSHAMSGLEDAFVNFVTTGKLSFKAMADAIIADLARIAVRKALAFGLEAAGSAFGFADGGVMTSRGPMPLRKYASGGIANRPQVAVFGEGSTPEAFVPLPDGQHIPVKMSGGGGGTSVVVNVNVTDKGSSQDVSGKDQGKELGSLIASVVRSELVNQQRPGGLLA